MPSTSSKVKSRFVSVGEPVITVGYALGLYVPWATQICAIVQVRAALRADSKLVKAFAQSTPVFAPVALVFT